MLATQHFLLFWLFSFATLLVAVFLLLIFSGLMNNEVELLTVRSELLVAASAAFLEGGGAWLLSAFIKPEFRPMAAKAMIIPLLIAAIIYKVAHYEDWTKFDVIFLFLFQLFVVGVAACLIAGQFKAAILFAVVLALVVFLMTTFARSLD